MKASIVALAGISVLIAVAGAKHQADKYAAARSIQVQNVNFPPLSLSARAAALKQFGSTLNPASLPSNPTTFTLTPQTPYNAQMNASLDALGDYETNLNRIVMSTGFFSDMLGQAQVVVGNANTTKTYLVSFNFYMSRACTPIMSMGKTFPPSSSTTFWNSYVVTGTPEPGQFSFSVVLLPGYNTAQIRLQAPEGVTQAVLQSVTVEQE